VTFSDFLFSPGTYFVCVCIHTCSYTQVNDKKKNGRDGPPLHLECVRVCAFVCMYVDVYVCVCARACVRVRFNTHTHTHTHTQGE
jgi:hypothetical protein